MVGRQWRSNVKGFCLPEIKKKNTMSGSASIARMALAAIYESSSRLLVTVIALAVAFSAFSFTRYVILAKYRRLPPEDGKPAAQGPSFDLRPDVDAASDVKSILSFGTCRVSPCYKPHPLRPADIIGGGYADCGGSRTSLRIRGARRGNTPAATAHGHLWRLRRHFW